MLKGFKAVEKFKKLPSLFCLPERVVPDAVTLLPGTELFELFFFSSPMQLVRLLQRQKKCLRVGVRGEEGGVW